jgi:hypothetical protein
MYKNDRMLYNELKSNPERFNTAIKSYGDFNDKRNREWKLTPSHVKINEKEIMEGIAIEDDATENIIKKEREEKMRAFQDVKEELAKLRMAPKIRDEDKLHEIQEKPNVKRIKDND